MTTYNLLDAATMADADVAAITDLDSASNGSQRADFFARRFAAHKSNPDAFVSMTASDGDTLVGFASCHLLQGEFGTDQLTAVLDTLAVEPGSQGHGIGHGLLAELLSELRIRGAQELRTQAIWNQPALLDFFADTGFELAPRLILERSTRDVQF
jgi:predicted N-acetyltransferase YhbS